MKRTKVLRIRAEENLPAASERPMYTYLSILLFVVVPIVVGLVYLVASLIRPLTDDDERRDIAEQWNRYRSRK